MLIIITKAIQTTHNFDIFVMFYLSRTRFIPQQKFIRWFNQERATEETGKGWNVSLHLYKWLCMQKKYT